MLEGTDGKKMSSSWGNIISIIDSPDEMFGKIMSLKDELIMKYFLLTTNSSLEKISKMEESLKNGENPMKFKKELAKEIISLYHSIKDADKAEENFNNTFQKKEIPEEMTELKLIKKNETLMDVLVREKIVSSKTDFRRLIKEGAVTDLDKNKKIIDSNFSAEAGQKIKIGKHRFVKIV